MFCRFEEPDRRRRPGERGKVAAGRDTAEEDLAGAQVVTTAFAFKKRTAVFTSSTAAGNGSTGVPSGAYRARR